MTTRIYVSKRALGDNMRHPDAAAEPVFVVWHNDERIRAHDVQILGPSDMVYERNADEHQPWARKGARAWVETEAPVVVLTEDDRQRFLD